VPGNPRQFKQNGKIIATNDNVKPINRTNIAVLPYVGGIYCRSAPVAMPLLSRAWPAARKDLLGIQPARRLSQYREALPRACLEPFPRPKRLSLDNSRFCGQGIHAK
jgi:hypothetical protein